MMPILDEKQQRRLSGIIASGLGYGEVSFVNSITGQSRNTIAAGAECADSPCGIGRCSTSQQPDAGSGARQTRRIRRPGGGRKPIENKYPDLAEKIEEIIKNQKMKQLGLRHPDRDAQFRFINDTSGDFLDKGKPVISVDTKKKENIGNFKNNGSKYRPKKGLRQVLDHDFPIPELGKAAPYGVYVLNNNTGFINPGISHDTPEFAGKSVYHWWKCAGENTFPRAKRLYITCDGGGSNGSRVWLWKYYLQRLSNETGLEIHVSHYPPGTSKWNKIEHRLFCYISKNWQGPPLIDIETTINLIGSTTTEKGLTVICRLDENQYETGLKITDEQKDSLNIIFNGPNEKWNYIIYPN